MKAYRTAIIEMLPRDSLRTLVSTCFDELEATVHNSTEEFRKVTAERDFYKGQFEQMQDRIERLQGNLTQAIIA
ncbi:hypothetical protein [Mesorhizobium sp.]|uniref:hypothetical protein n=1 Tax=Mesorhizobium sp. TaxID=1871066 RepID=UPI000FE56042|nr:hypothetical protein [Mesorhizobium sp.]RWM84322.1 MAG: hypothetical protein EOR83_17020 [Mesorhizobium sp.]